MDSVSAEYRDDLLIITVAGKFTLPFFKDFYTTYKNLRATPGAIDIDLSRVESIDGIGLGMLLSMRNYFGADMPMRLCSANESVLKNLRIARLDKHFDIDS